MIWVFEGWQWIRQLDVCGAPLGKLKTAHFCYWWASESEKRGMTQRRRLPELLIRDGPLLAHAGWGRTVRSICQERHSRLLCYRWYDLKVSGARREAEGNRLSKNTKIMTTPSRKDGDDCGGHVIYSNFHYSVFLFPTPCFFLANFLSCCSPIINRCFLSRCKIANGKLAQINVLF